MIIKATIKKTEDNDTILMRDMKPLEVGVFDDGAIVMRTQSQHNQEVMHLSDPRPGSGWTDASAFGTGVKVRLLKKGETLTIEIKGTA